MKTHFVNNLFAAAGLLSIAYYVALGMTVRFNQSLMWIWPLLSVFLLSRHVLYARTVLKGMPLPFAGWMVIAFRALVCIGIIIFIIVEGIIFKAGFATAPGGLDYIIVLGAKVNGTTPGGALRNRIQVASEYAKANPDTLIVASGGQGADEGISEAECIYRELVKRGIDPSRIIIEDKSTSTQENIYNTLSIIDVDANTRIGLVTNDFHIYRSLRIAQTAPICEWYGIRVATSPISFPHYMVREFAAVAIETIKGEI